MIRGLDFQLILSTAILIAISFLIHQSISPGDLNIQIAFTAVGILLGLAITRIDLKSLVVFRHHLYFFITFLLLATIFFGTAIRGSSRWLVLGPLRLQPSELSKPLLIFSFAGALTQVDLKLFKNIIKLLFLYLLPIILVALQPDFGSAFVLSAIFVTMAFTSGIRIKHFLALALIGLLVTPLAYANLKPYQKERIATFVNPSADPLGKGYNSIQSIIAVGSGKIFGRGLGHGTQSKLRFLPEYQTDFVFASLAEELGLVGSLLVIFAYAWMILRLIFLSRHTNSAFSFLTIIGIAAMIAAQAIINIGMNLGLLPITGITLPLISSGGSSIVTTLVSIGIAIKLSQGQKRAASIEIS